MLVMTVCLGGAPGARATFAGRDGEILSFNTFSPPAIGGFWLSGPHGRGSHPLVVPANVVNAGGDETFPTFSPSGKKLAFLVSSDSEMAPPYVYEVDVTNADGSAARVVVQGSLPRSFIETVGLAFSPDGRVLAFAYNYGALTRLVFVKVQTGRLVRSMVLRSDVSSLAWSASGDLLSVTDVDSLYAMRPNGTHRRRVKIRFPGGSDTDWGIDDLAEKRPVAPSPDGSQLAVAATNDVCGRGGDISVAGPLGHSACDAEDVFLVSAAGGKATRLGRGGCGPVWSPNGRRVIFGCVSTQPVISLATGRTTRFHLPGEVLDWQALPK